MNPTESGRAGARWRFLQALRFPNPPAEPDVRVSTHPAEHDDRARGNLDRHGVHFLTANVAGV